MRSIGSLLTLPTALVIFGGAAIRLIIEYMLAEMKFSDPEAAVDWPSDSTSWIGGGAMTAAVIYAMLRFLSPTGAAMVDELSKSEAELLSLPSRVVSLLWVAIAAGSCLMGLQILLTNGPRGILANGGHTVGVH